MVSFIGKFKKRWPKCITTRINCIYRFDERTEFRLLKILIIESPRGFQDYRAPKFYLMLVPKFIRCTLFFIENKQFVGSSIDSHGRYHELKSNRTKYERINFLTNPRLFFFKYFDVIFVPCNSYCPRRETLNRTFPGMKVAPKSRVLCICLLFTGNVFLFSYYITCTM